MNDLIIPGWAIAVFGSVGMIMLGWLVWLTKEVYANKETIAINTAHDLQVQRELEKIYKAVDELKESFSADIKSISAKLDTFIAAEINLLKNKLGQ